MTFQEWQRSAVPEPVRFFSLARHALVAALRAAGVGVSDRVLLPEFICRDVLASLHAVGATAVWYPVGEDLRPASAPEDWPEARAVLAVDYFGFPQPLEPFRAYVKRTGALLVEDNAHGLLSRDEDGRWLGTRAGAGIFSLRKTLPISDGAMLAIGDERLARNLPEPLAESGRGGGPGAALKARLRRLPVVGVASAAAMTGLVRGLRRIRTGHAISPSSPADELTIPGPPAPHAGLTASLAALDVDREIERRRTLYREAEALARAAGIAPLFPGMPRLVSPYGFAFRITAGDAAASMQRWATTRGLDVFRWPDLPSTIEKRLPEFHHTLRLVNFL